MELRQVNPSAALENDQTSGRAQGLSGTACRILAARGDGGMANNATPYKTGMLQKKGRHGGFKDRTFTLTRSALEYSTTTGVPKGSIMLEDISSVEPGPDPGQLTVMTAQKTFLMQVPPHSTIRSNAQHEAASWAEAIDKLCQRSAGQVGRTAGSANLAAQHMVSD